MRTKTKISSVLIVLFCLMASVALFFAIPQKTEIAEASFNSEQPSLSAIDNNFYNGPGDDLNIEDLNKLTVEEVAAQKKYNSQQYGLITPVKNQGAKSLCWAYATASASEASILKEGFTEYNSDTLRLSADNIAYTKANKLAESDETGFSADEVWKTEWDNGSFVKDSARRLMQWDSPVIMDAGDNENNFHQVMTPSYLLEDYIEVPFNEPQKIKESIVKYGAVAISYNAQFGGNVIYYNSVGVDYNRPHAVVIVGWNDDIPKEYFVDGYNKKNIPTQPGGWIVKNSWGPSLAYNGYFILSYDSPIDEVYAFNYMDNPGNMYNYYYDGTVSSNESYHQMRDVAVVYKARKVSDNKSEFLDSVNVAVSGQDVTIDVKVYTNIKANFGNPYLNSDSLESGDLVGVGTRTVDLSGAYTVRLKQPVELKAEQQFSIVVKISSPVRMASVVFCEEQSNNDMTFIREVGGSGWKNTREKKNEVAMVKAFTHTEEKKETDKKSVLYADIKFDKTSYDKGEDVFLPEVRLTYKGSNMLENRDYDLSYKEYINDKYRKNEILGWGEITITGKGEYADTRTECYQILVGSCPYITFGEYNKGSGFIEIKTDNSVNKLGDIRLDKGWSFQNPDKEISGKTNDVLSYKGEDMYHYKKHDFNVYVEKKESKEPTDISGDDFKVLFFGSEQKQAYKGRPITPNVGLTYKGRLLRLNIDYALVFEDNDNIGYGKAIFYGKNNDDYNFTGIREATFVIGDEKNILKSVEYAGERLVYDGTEKQLELKVYNALDELVDEKDYQVTISDELINTGKYTITVTGTGDMHGTATTEVTIDKASTIIGEITVTDGVASATTNYGEVVIKYYSDKDCTTEIEAPTEAGTYYIKAEVMEGDNFTGAVRIKEYVIEPEKTGCFGSFDGGMIVAMLSVLAVSAVILRKRHN